MAKRSGNTSGNTSGKSAQSKPPIAKPATVLARVEWEGTSRKVIQDWPKPIRIDFGIALNEMQEGRPATLDVRPMSSIGDGVFELKTEDAATWYRLMYIARINNVIYVLDCFEKKTAKTEKKDLERSRKRYKLVHQRLIEDQKNATSK